MKDTCGYIVYVIYVPVAYIIYYTTLGIVFNVYFTHNDKKWFINTGKCSLSAEIVGTGTCGSPVSCYLALRKWHDLMEWQSSQKKCWEELWIILKNALIYAISDTGSDFAYRPTLDVSIYTIHVSL